MEIFYKKDGIVVRRSIPGDIKSMKNRLRDSDVKEIWDSHHHTPETALRLCVDKAIFSATIENGRPIGIFGISAEYILGGRATVFMLATEDLDKIQMRFLRNCKYFVNQLLEWYPILENWVSSDNKKSIEWLRFLGATIEEAKPYGVEGKLFHHFYFIRKD